MKWKWAGLLLIVFTALLIGCEAESENDPAAVNYEETIYRSGWNEEQKKEEEKLIELQSKEELQEFVDFFPPYEEGLEESIFYKEETYQSHRVFAYALVGISGSNQLEVKEAVLENGELTLRLEHFIPEIRTMDMTSRVCLLAVEKDQANPIESYRAVVDEVKE